MTTRPMYNSQSQKISPPAAWPFVLQTAEDEGKRTLAQKPGARRRDLEAEIQASGQERLPKRRRGRRNEDVLSVGKAA